MADVDPALRGSRINPARGSAPRDPLCVSGSGFRAALFHLGWLRRLNELGLFGKVDVISSVLPPGPPVMVLAAAGRPTTRDRSAERRIEGGLPYNDKNIFVTGSPYADLKKSEGGTSDLAESSRLCDFFRAEIDALSPT